MPSKKDNKNNRNIYGQNKVFDLEDENVNHLAVKYLQDVKLEAMTTLGFEINQIQSTLKNTIYEADIYDDDQNSNANGDTNNANNSKAMSKSYQDAKINTRCINWYRKTQKTILSNDTNNPLNNDDILNNILYQLKLISLSLNSDEQISHTKIIELLKNVPENLISKYIIDDATLEKYFNSLSDDPKIKTTDDVKQWFKNRATYAPKGFTHWFNYIQENEPSHSIFYNNINEKSFWTLIQYMCQNWIKMIKKNKKHLVCLHLKQWLFYLVIHLPNRLTADQTNSVRQLAKKCQQHSDFKDTADFNFATNEMKLLNITPPFNDNQISIFQLVVIVIAKQYGQFDLLEKTLSDEYPPEVPN
ncbi:hypothetical protein TBLA_0B02450 [Henningerozyma blattae CBS 6284]|uniref:Uncharacterized protein n=1 Tax=Henningerozyma blattae (strain ATCC 34711 / CBS 6284 / DSM 70876 / NBRC 10599 / NRRL Y-10934 / UCD 77-7) TaxID=1071380 RepID=I2GY85_HENB6|nr:hypothetical protein TBLA_0B02450 [Tetrapisispora blattae CBS 6284]CCH59087.1 hypothetical protein TBLA_0B02450 [Tetrapisispora blattae CBS 6284]